MDWFLYDIGVRHERVKLKAYYIFWIFVKVLIKPYIKKTKNIIHIIYTMYTINIDIDIDRYR